MAKLKMPPGTPDDTEAAFYEALHQADIDRLMACWADEDEIVCVHPGGPRLVGHAAVRAAFEAMFANGGVQANPERVRRLVAASIVYVMTGQGWRMGVHHSSPGSRTEPVEVADARPLLH